MTTLSVLIPTLNEAKLLPRLLLSLRRQKGIDFEVLVVDGGSSDGTVRVAKRFSNSLRLNVIAAPKGTARQRNAGTAKAKAPLLAFIDADMHIKCSDFLAGVVQAFEDKSVVGVTADMHVLPALATWSDSVFSHVVNAMIRLGNLARIGGWMRGGCFCCRKKDLRAIGGFSTRFACGEDNECANRLAKRGRIKVLRKCHIYEHPRRYRSWGYPKIVLNLIANAVWWAVFSRSFSKEWERTDE